MCAESAAISAAVVDGMNRGDLDRILIYSDSVQNITPCGACRQIICEFAHNDTLVVTLAQDGQVHKQLISSLLPSSFVISHKKN